MNWQDRQDLKDLYLIGLPMAIAAALTIVGLVCGVVFAIQWLVS